jgi:hypothetical protein
MASVFVRIWAMIRHTLKREPSIFLCHSSKDRPFVRRLARRLELEGVGVWLDEAEIKIGESLTRKVTQAIDRVDFVGAVLSQNSINSDWVQRELGIAFQKELRARRIVVLPLLLEPVEIPSFLGDKLYADFTTPDKFEEACHRVLRTMDVMPSASSPVPTQVPPRAPKPPPVVEQSWLKIKGKIFLNVTQAAAAMAEGKSVKDLREELTLFDDVTFRPLSMDSEELVFSIDIANGPSDSATIYGRTAIAPILSMEHIGQLSEKLLEGLDSVQGKKPLGPDLKLKQDILKPTVIRLSPDVVAKFSIDQNTIESTPLVVLKQHLVAPVLARRLETETEPIIRHWLAHALGHIGGEEACAALRAAEARETDSYAMEGITGGLRAAGDRAQ